MKMHPAQKEARAVARSSGFDAAKVKRMIDTEFAKPYPCWMVTQKRGQWAIVIYEDEPNAVVSVGNKTGRFKQATV